MSYSEKIGWRDAQCIRRLRELSGLDRSEFALKLGINRFTLNRIESGDVLPSALVMRAAQKVFPPEVFEAAFVEMPSEEGLVTLNISDAEVLSTGSDETDISPAQRVVEVRESCGMTVRELAKRISVSPKELERIESGERSLTIRRAQRIAEVCSVGEDYLLYGFEDRRDHPVNEKLINYLWEHPDLRSELWDKLEE